MACVSAFDALRFATENLSDTIRTKATPQSVLMSVVPKGNFPKGKGVSQTTFKMGNSMPIAVAEGWTDITLSNNALSSACSASFTEVEVGFEEETYGPRKFSLKGPVICKDNLEFAHNASQFISKYENEMVKRAKWSWEIEYTDRIFALADKRVCDTTFTRTQGVTTQPTVEPTSELNWDYLEEDAMTLIQEGATNVDGNEIELGPDGPVFPIFIHPKMKQKLFKNISEKRSDVRQIQEGMGDRALLFRRLGATDTHQNYRMIPWLFPIRGNYVNGIIVRVATWEMVAGTEGKVAQLTAAWKNAELEAAIINPSPVFTAEMIAGDNAGLDFNPSNYMGDWTWVTGGAEITEGSTCFDPLKKLGRHFAEFRYAPRPDYPEYGRVVWYKRCPNDYAQSTCTYS